MAYSIEDHLCAAHNRAALLLVLTRSLAQSDDLCLPRDVQNRAWPMLSDSCESLVGHIRAIEKAIPREALFVKTPDHQ